MIREKKKTPLFVWCKDVNKKASKKAIFLFPIKMFQQQSLESRKEQKQQTVLQFGPQREVFQ